MKVLITTAYQPPASAVPEFRQHAARDRFGVHSLTDDPAAADVILFVDARADQNDWELRAIRRHELTRRYPDKAFVYCEMDQAWCAMPGLYTSMPRRDFVRKRQRACGYHIVRLGEAMAAQTEAFGEPEHLFSFMGRSLPGPREAVLRLRHPRGSIEDTSQFNFFGGAAPGLEEQERRYTHGILNSKFVLCPAGAGPSSIRLFETLGAGRVPVILSDDWTEIDGPDWAACSLRVPERDIARLPALLEQREADWSAMGAAARRVYREWFAADAVFHRLTESCLDLQRRRTLPERLLRLAPSRRYARLWLRHAKSVILRRYPILPRR